MIATNVVTRALFALVLGCGPYELPTVAHNHPASAEAVVAAPAPRSKTLAYSQADLPGIAATRIAQNGHQEHHKSEPAAPEKRAVGEGKVIATVPNAAQVVVEHGRIEGFMDAMTMGYRVEPASLLEGLRAGDQIRFTIDVPNKAIIQIEKK